MSVKKTQWEEFCEIVVLLRDGFRAETQYFGRMATASFYVVMTIVCVIGMVLVLLFCLLNVLCLNKLNDKWLSEALGLMLANFRKWLFRKPYAKAKTFELLAKDYTQGN